MSQVHDRKPEEFNNDYQPLNENEERRYPTTRLQVPAMDNEDNVRYEIAMPEGVKLMLILMAICCFTIFFIILLLK
jgi:hypothetical protein